MIPTPDEMVRTLCCWGCCLVGITTTDYCSAKYGRSRICTSCMEGQGLGNVLIEVFPELTTEFTLGIDNQAAYVMATNPTFSRRTWHYVRDQVTKKTVSLQKVKTDVNPSDLLTKPLASYRLEIFDKIISLKKEQLPK
ncbi:Copiatype Polyprotein [Phytophthora palmivora]|uniref:Copiatype Polyprotein n=1 Tax=Phytophthora palmivora TaxID=4796 RepID=A0A2P4X334_9STRA|nr:Copiatype Polyprotein [Phytophthora palmivora]